MFKNTKNYLIVAIFVAVVPFCALFISPSASATDYTTAISAFVLSSISNQERINAGLAPLSLNSNLSAAANAKAIDMIADNYWAHYAPDGASPWTFISASGYDYSSAGENLAKDFTTSGGVIAGWMSSPTHRANLLKSNYVDVGYAVVNGLLLGSETTIVVAMYGAPIEPTPTPAPVIETVMPQSVDVDQQNVVQAEQVSPVVSEKAPRLEPEQNISPTTNDAVISKVQTSAVGQVDMANSPAVTGQVEGAASLSPTAVNGISLGNLALQNKDIWMIIAVLVVIMLFFTARGALSSQRVEGGNLRI